MVTFKCPECGRVFDSTKGFATHLTKIHKYTDNDKKNLYLKINNLEEPTCPYCKCPKKFKNMTEGFFPTCKGEACKKNYYLDKYRESIQESIAKNGYPPSFSPEAKAKRENTNIIRYGCKSPFGNKEVRKKIEKAVFQHYGVTHIWQAEEIKEAICQTNIQKFGVENPSQSEEIKRKKEATSINNFGVKYHLQNPDQLANLEKTFINRYGVNWASQIKDFKKKVETTSLIKRGVRHHTQDSKVKEKFKNTCLERYGCPNLLVSSEVIQANRKRLRNEYLTNGWGAKRKWSADEYKRLVGIFTEKNVREHFHDILKQSKSAVKELFLNNEDFLIIQQKRLVHLDHRFSKLNGYLNNVPPEIIGYWYNLEYLLASDNMSKNSDNSITLENLVDEYKRNSGDTHINYVPKKVYLKPIKRARRIDEHYSLWDDELNIRSVN